MYRKIRSWLNHFLQWSDKRWSVLTLFLYFSVAVSAQELYPKCEGEQVRFSAYIEMKRAYLSGLCILVGQSDGIKGSIFNEFGISAIDFSYHASRDRIKLHNVIKKMDKWYIRRVLRKDLKCLMHRLQQGNTIYEDNKYHISYTFTPMKGGAE